MADEELSAAIAQRIIIRFLVNEHIKPAEILRRLKAQFRDQTLKKTQVYEWCARFREGRESVCDNDGRGGSSPTVVNDANIQRVEKLISSDRGLTVRQIVEKTSISAGSVEKIIHDHLRLHKVSSGWVPRTMIDPLKEEKVSVD